MNAADYHIIGHRNKETNMEKLEQMSNLELFKLYRRLVRMSERLSLRGEAHHQAALRLSGASGTVAAKLQIRLVDMEVVR